MGMLGWTGLTSSPSPAAEPSKDGGYIAPDRSARAQCWEMRDAFFDCLDRHDIVDSVKEDDKASKVCAPELKEFEKSCASSWVTYFKKRRVFEYQKAKTLEKLEAENAASTSAGSVAAASLKGSQR